MNDLLWPGFILTSSASAPASSLHSGKGTNERPLVARLHLDFIGERSGLLASHVLKRGHRGVALFSQRVCILRETELLEFDRDGVLCRGVRLRLLLCRSLRLRLLLCRSLRLRLLLCRSVRLRLLLCRSVRLRLLCRSLRLGLLLCRSVR